MNLEYIEIIKLEQKLSISQPPKLATLNKCSLRAFKETIGITAQFNQLDLVSVLNDSRSSYSLLDFKKMTPTIIRFIDPTHKHENINETIGSYIERTCYIISYTIIKDVGVYLIIIIENNNKSVIEKYKISEKNALRRAKENMEKYE